MSGIRISRDLVGGIVFLAVGIVATWSANDLSMGSVKLLGPGALPTLLGIVMVLLAIVLIAQALGAASKQRSDEEAPESWGRTRVAFVAALIALYIAILPLAGFLVASAILMVALYATGTGRLFSLFPFVAGILTSTAAYVLFVMILGVRLPSGLLWSW